MRPSTRPRPFWRLALVFIALLGGLRAGSADAAPAQDALRWTTNYYRVTGNNPREVRQSMNESRPWRARNDSDAITAWSVTWTFTFTSSGQGCRLDSVRTATTITTTLPVFVPPTNAPTELKQRWAAYFTALARHEGQHALMATRAAAEIQSRLSSAGERINCPTLQRDLNAMAESIVARYRQEEREMDRTTRHGAADGARFP